MQPVRTSQSPTSTKPQSRRLMLPLFALLLANVLVGLLVFRDYGESWDERRRYRYAGESLAAYAGDRQIDEALQGDEKGPSYVMLARLFADGLARIFPGVTPMEGFHLAHFLSFQLGVVFFYLLCLREVSPWAAFGATLLYTTQPLLWGHAFINPKDIPFLTFLMGGLLSGFALADSWVKREGRTADGAWERILQAARAEWQSAGRQAQARFFLAAGMLAGIALLLLIGRDFIEALAGRLLGLFYHAALDSPAGMIFARFAESAGRVPLEDYTRRVMDFYPWLLAGGLLMLAALTVWLLRRGFPATWLALINEEVRPLFRGGNFVRLFWGAFGLGAFWPAVVFLGFTAAIRAGGLVLVGGLAAWYFFRRAGLKAVPALLAYGLTGFGVMLLLWPEMWSAPLETLRANLVQSGNFLWSGKVRFAGADYFTDQLPAVYLPWLMLIQLSEPALLLAVLGTLLAFRRRADGGENRLWSLYAGWLFVPLLLVVLTRPRLYDNFRHFLFIIPPVFLLAGLALEEFYRRLSAKWIYVLVVALLLLPGLFWIVRLHPYQYVYYNSLVGGVGGAFRSYELDYWVTSYKEAAEELNGIAPQGALILVDGGAQVFSAYTRPDLSVGRFTREDAAGEADYVVLPARNDKDVKFFPGAPAVVIAGREGAIFTVIKQISGSR